jgi:hypothetical protein
VTEFLRRIDPEQLQAVLSGWLMKTYGKELHDETVLMDG